MRGSFHRLATRRALEITRDLAGLLPLLGSIETVAEEAAATDDRKDMELIDVEGGIGSGGRDDPHKDELFADDDKPHFGAYDESFSAFNHFIDIKKGHGLFDDYDGYSYAKGSASKDQYQSAADASTHYSYWRKAFVEMSGKNVDEGLKWWLNDEYVHALGQEWYRGCSPAAERYSYPADKGAYPNIQEELKARFPRAQSTGSAGMGVPYSVFMPVDNLARYWYGRYLATRNAADLGPVMHAIEDASIPHHAAGYCGNWHGRYEEQLETEGGAWLTRDAALLPRVRALLTQWNRSDPRPPLTLEYFTDCARLPARNWRIDYLVTWVALHAYFGYERIYRQFREGYRFDPGNARHLTTLAAAMCAHVSLLAAGAAPSVLPKLTGRYDQTIKMMHLLSVRSLHSHPYNYGHPGSSGQQQITAYDGADDNDLWRIKGPHGQPATYRATQPVQNGDIIRLEHVFTKRNLHGHGGIPSPVTGQQEVTCYGANGEGDSNDNWRIEIEGGGAWESGKRVRLVHVNTNHALHSHEGLAHPNWTRGQQEVTGYAPRDDNDWWLLAEVR